MYVVFLLAFPRLFIVYNSKRLLNTIGRGQFYEEAFITASTLNVRSEPGTNYSKLGEVYAGESYYIGVLNGNHLYILNRSTMPSALVEHQDW